MISQNPETKFNSYLILGSTKSCPRRRSCMTLGVKTENYVIIKTKINLKTKIGMTFTMQIHKIYHTTGVLLDNQPSAQ